MHCDEIQNRLSAALDGELPRDEHTDVERHLAECAACRDAMSALQSFDLQFRREAAPARSRAARIAQAATSCLPPETATAPRGAASSWPRNILLTLAAMACGFLLAVLTPGPWHGDAEPSAISADTVTVDPPQRTMLPAPAIIRAATGPVEISTTRPVAWTPLAQPDGFACQPGLAVRTPGTTVCELETASGATVRMNSHTELAIAAADDFRLSQGEIWCRTSEAAGLKVTSAVNEPTVEPPVSLMCGTDGPAICLFTCPPEAARMRVSVASGRLELVSRNHSQQFDAGCSVEIQSGAVQMVASQTDVPSERWMHPLIVRKGPSDIELAMRVNTLLAEVGRTKLSYLRERDLRSFGEYGALPLLRFVQSKPSIADAERRQTAAKILADVAPAWMIPDLIELLADADPAVRISAATGLRRLTGETQGKTAESWGDADRDLTASLAQWQAWWQSEGQAYPTPPAGVRP